MMESSIIIAKVVDYIEDNLDDSLTLDSIAKRVGYSKFHLNRLFSQNTGRTIHKYIQLRRLTKAAKQLVFTKKPIVEIAFEANYDSQQSFTLAFRRLYICAPLEYRMKGIYIPKLDRFVVRSSAVMGGRFRLNSEVRAA